MVRNLGQIGDSTVASIAAQLSSVSGVTASVSGDGRLLIESDAPTSKFTFGEDTSGFLAAVGINTFFTGESAKDIAVNQTIIDDLDLLAVSAGGVDQDTDTLYELLDLVDRPTDSLDGRSIRGLYEQTLSRIGREVSLATSSTEGLNDFYETLRSQHLAITGVNIDEESIKMISYQRAFQASSRVISTASEMLEILMNL
jgi:flagellar hook-associated protein 1 FlgK